VSVTLAELAGSLREGLLALAVGAGFQVMESQPRAKMGTQLHEHHWAATEVPRDSGNPPS
jgi:hypothetical protein